MSAKDLDAIALVAYLPHKTRGKACSCEWCVALRRVVALAREAVARKAAKHAAQRRKAV